jgi:hypothetical protein
MPTTISWRRSGCDEMLRSNPGAVQQEKAVFSVGSWTIGILARMVSMMGPSPLELCWVAITGMSRILAAVIRRLMLSTTLSSSSGGIAAASRSCASMMSSCEKARWHSGICA